MNIKEYTVNLEAIDKILILLDIPTYGTRRRGTTFAFQDGSRMEKRSFQERTIALRSGNRCFSGSVHLSLSFSLYQILVHNIVTWSNYVRLRNIFFSREARKKIVYFPFCLLGKIKTENGMFTQKVFFFLLEHQELSINDNQHVGPL